jgi:hypothetical protein
MWIRGCALSMLRNSVVPERPEPMMKMGRSLTVRGRYRQAFAFALVACQRDRGVDASVSVQVRGF